MAGEQRKLGRQKTRQLSILDKDLTSRASFSIFFPCCSIFFFSINISRLFPTYLCDHLTPNQNAMLLNQWDADSLNRSKVVSSLCRMKCKLSEERIVLQTCFYSARMAGILRY